jgi:Hyaluronan / mRNA binding family
MTRTERAAFPRAVVKDRSLSRSGLDKSIRKNGAGQHNWGSISDEAELEFAALEDEEHDIAADAEGTYALSREFYSDPHPLRSKFLSKCFGGGLVCKDC